MKKLITLIVACYVSNIFGLTAAQSIEIDGLYYIKSQCDGETVMQIVTPPEAIYSGSVTLPPSVNYKGEEYYVNWRYTGAFTNSEVSELTIANNWGKLVDKIPNQNISITGNPELSKITILDPGETKEESNENDFCLTIRADDSKVMDMSFEYTDENIIVSIHRLNIYGPDGKQLVPFVRDINTEGDIKAQNGKLILPKEYSYAGAGFLTVGNGITRAFMGFEVNGKKILVCQEVDMNNTGVTINHNDLDYNVFIDGTVGVRLPLNKKCYTGNITIPQSVEYENKIYPVSRVCHSAFYGSKITSLTIEGNMPRICDYAFRNCKDVKFVSIANCENTIIGNSAFAGCSALEEVILPKQSFADNWYYTFIDCSALKSIALPKGPYMFNILNNCDNIINLKGIEYNADEIKLTLNPTIYQNDGVTKIALYASTPSNNNSTPIINEDGSLTFSIPTSQLKDSYSGNYNGNIVFHIDPSKSDYLKESSFLFALSIPQYSGVTDITTEPNKGPVTYFNLQGVRVDNPTSGVYIRVQGNNATKVLIR